MHCRGDQLTWEVIWSYTDRELSLLVVFVGEELRQKALVDLACITKQE